MNRRRILTLLGFGGMVGAAEAAALVDPLLRVPPAPKPVDPVRAASLLLQETQGCLQELTDALLGELNGIPELKAAGLYFRRSTEGSGSVWRPKPMAGLEQSLFTTIAVHRRRHSPSFAHLDLNEVTGAIELTEHSCWLPAEVIRHPLWETDRFVPSLKMHRKPTIEP